MIEKNYRYDGTFRNNILVAGKTGCGKAMLVENLKKNKMFGELESVDWVSKIKLSANVVIEIKRWFADTNIEFHYLDDLSDFNVLIEAFQQERLNEDNSAILKKKKLIVKFLGKKRI